MTVGRICVREVFVARPEETAQAAAERMRQENVGALVVVDSQQRPVGILTDRDLTVRLVAARRDSTETTVAAVMTANPRTLEEQTPIEDALALMRSGAFRRLPIVDNGGRLAGLMTADDILGLLAEELTEIGQLLAKQGTGPMPGGTGRVD